MINLIGCFGVQYSCIFLRVLQYFDGPAGRVKIQRTSKNIQRYCTPKHLISYLLYNCFDQYVFIERGIQTFLLKLDNRPDH